jgi:hypothetical protein
MTAAIALATALTACASSKTGTSTQSKVQEAQATHEYPSPPTTTESASGGAGSPVEAIRHFAMLYINWDPDTVAAQMRELAIESVGQARSAMELAAAQTSRDYELQQGGISNNGSVEAIAPLARGRDKYAVVTRESTSATNTAAYQGLRPAWHVAVATVVELRSGRWVVSGWQPEN